MNSSGKVIDNGDKNFFSPSDNVNHKLFHEYSAPDLGHAPKNHVFEPVKTPIISKMDPYIKPGSSQFDSPTHNNNSQFQYNKYSSPQQQGPSPTFLNKYNSDKTENRFNPSKNFAFESNPVQNSHGMSGFSPLTAFSKKDKKFD